MTPPLSMGTYIPVGPSGTYLNWLASRYEEEAWSKLMEEGSKIRTHLQYKTKEDYINKGYKVIKTLYVVKLEGWGRND